MISGKDHLTYAQGASAELVAMTTIGAADAFGLPVSTTHVLSSGRRGHHGREPHPAYKSRPWRNLMLAWVPTLPVSMILAGSLFWLFNKFAEPWPERRPTRYGVGFAGAEPGMGEEPNQRTIEQLEIPRDALHAELELLKTTRAQRERHFVVPAARATEQRARRRPLAGRQTLVELALPDREQRVAW